MNTREPLTAQEQLDLSSLLANQSLMGALKKCFKAEAEMADESVRNEALGEVRINQIILYASRSRFAREFEQTIRNRIQTLTAQQRVP